MPSMKASTASASPACDTAGSAWDLFVACSLQPQLELGCTVSAENQMGMTIHQSGGDPPPGAIDPFGRIRARWKVGTRAGEGDAAIPRCDHAVLDHAEVGPIPPNRGEPGIVSDSIEVLGHAAFPSTAEA